jgi:hypothetical protein
MATAEKILITGGTLLLVYAFVTGYLLGVARRRAPVGPKYLILAHSEPLAQGAMLLGLVWAIRLSDLADGIEVTAAILLVGAAWLQGIKELVNWRQGIVDEFSERPPFGFWAGRVQSTAASIGLVLIVIGVVHGLF